MLDIERALSFMPPTDLYVMKYFVWHQLTRIDDNLYEYTIIIEISMWISLLGHCTSLAVLNAP